MFLIHILIFFRYFLSHSIKILSFEVYKNRKVIGDTHELPSTSSKVNLYENMKYLNKALKDSKEPAYSEFATSENTAGSSGSTNTVVSNKFLDTKLATINTEILNMKNDIKSLQNTKIAEWKKIATAEFTTSAPRIDIRDIDFSKYNEIMIQLRYCSAKTTADMKDVMGSVILPVKGEFWWSYPYRYGVAWIGSGDVGLQACIILAYEYITIANFPRYNGTSLYASYSEAGGPNTLILYAR